MFKGPVNESKESYRGGPENKVENGRILPYTMAKNEQARARKLSETFWSINQLISLADD